MANLHYHSLKYRVKLPAILERDERTERHFNFICNPFNAHKRERDNSNDRDSRPSQFLDQGKRESEEIQCDTLL